MDRGACERRQRRFSPEPKGVSLGRYTALSPLKHPHWFHDSFHIRRKRKVERQDWRGCWLIRPRAAATLRHSSPPGVRLSRACLIYSGSVLAFCEMPLLSGILSSCPPHSSLSPSPNLYFLSGRPIFHRLANSAVSSPLQNGGAGGEVSFERLPPPEGWDRLSETQVSLLTVQLRPQSSAAAFRRALTRAIESTPPRVRTSTPAPTRLTFSPSPASAMTSSFQ